MVWIIGWGVDQLPSATRCHQGEDTGFIFFEHLKWNFQNHNSTTTSTSNVVVSTWKWIAIAHPTQTKKKSQQGLQQQHHTTTTTCHQVNALWEVSWWNVYMLIGSWDWKTLFHDPCTQVTMIIYYVSELGVKGASQKDDGGSYQRLHIIRIWWGVKKKVIHYFKLEILCAKTKPPTKGL